MARLPRARQGDQLVAPRAGAAALLLAVLFSLAPVCSATVTPVSSAPPSTASPSTASALPASASPASASSGTASYSQASAKQFSSGSADISDLRRASPAGALPPFALTSFALLLAGGAGLAWSRVAKSSKPSAPAQAEPPLDPIRALGDLAASFRNGALPADLLCLQSAALLRSQLALRTGVPAARLTTEELLHSLTGPQLLCDADVALAGSLLDLCDRVKFAGQSLDRAQAEWLLSSLGAFLEQAGGERHEVS